MKSVTVPQFGRQGGIEEGIILLNVHRNEIVYGGGGGGERVKAQ